MSSPSKWELDGIFLMNHEKVMPWSSYSWLFNCPKIETFASWVFLSHTLRIMIKNWSNDVCGFKIRCWPKFLTFDCQMTILPLQLTVWAIRVFDCATWNLTCRCLTMFMSIWDLIEPLNPIYILRYKKIEQGQLLYPKICPLISFKKIPSCS